MKSRLFYLFFVLAGVPLLAAPTATVQVKEASLYAKPSAVSKFLGKLAWGTALTVLEEKNGWGRVQAPQGLTGWLRTQAYATADASLRSTKAGAADVSSTEVSLAGRGFSEEVETSYRKNNPELDFSILDRMEDQGLDPNELTAFLRDGGLTPREVE